MSIFDLPTKGMNVTAQFNILRRHLFAFLKHLTIKKLWNFSLAEYNSLTKKSRISSYPYILKIEPSNICNLKCQFCYDNRRPPSKEERPFGRMSFEHFSKLVDEVGPYLFKINLYGFGEPFLFPETFEMIKYATAKNIGVGVSSNLNLDDPTVCEKIVNSGLETLIFSCHGVTQESYSKFMVNGNMDLAMKNIRDIIAIRRKLGSVTPLIDWQFCVTQFNQEEIGMAKAKAKELGIDQIRFIKPFFPEEAGEEWRSDLFPKTVFRPEVDAPPSCSWIYRSAYINYDGNLLPCCRDFRRIENDFGNVFKEGFATVWNNEKYVISRRLVANPNDKSITCDTLCSRCPVTYSRSRLVPQIRAERATLPPKAGESAAAVTASGPVNSAYDIFLDCAGMTLGKLLERNARQIPWKTAVVFHDRTLTYVQLNDSVNRLANSMIAIGINKGDRVGLMLPRIPELIIGFLAAAKAGGTVVPINYELPAKGIRTILEKTRPRFIIVADMFSELVKESLPSDLPATIISTGENAHGWVSWNDMMKTDDAHNPAREPEFGDVVYLNYTSGSTGNSKGAVTTHAHIYWNTYAAVEALGLTPDDVHLCMFAPFAHPHELFARPLYLGGTMVLLDNVYPKSLAQAIADNGVSCVMGLAPMYENLLAVLEHKAYNIQSLRIPESGGMFTRLDLIERFQQKLGVPIIPVWGSTETTGIALANRPGEDIIPCSAGRPCASYDVKIVDEDGKELSPGEVGEMIFKGPALVQRYYEDETSTAACFRDDWYYSGDYARRDERGNFYFVERKCGMMKVAGFKVFPLEIEQVLLDHPGIKEAAVITAKDRLRGEVPKAIIVPKHGWDLTEKEVLQFCRERLAHYKLPRLVEIRQSLPKSGSGKINKKALQMEHV